MCRHTAERYVLVVDSAVLGEQLHSLKGLFQAKQLYDSKTQCSTSKYFYYPQERQMTTAVSQKKHQQKQPFCKSCHCRQHTQLQFPPLPTVACGVGHCKSKPQGAGLTPPNRRGNNPKQNPFLQRYLKGGRMQFHLRCCRACSLKADLANTLFLTSNSLPQK